MWQVTDEDRQKLFADLTFLMPPLPTRQWLVQGAKEQDGFVHVTPFLLSGPGGGEGRAPAAGPAVLGRSEYGTRTASAEGVFPPYLGNKVSGAARSCKQVIHHTQSSWRVLANRLNLSLHCLSGGISSNWSARSPNHSGLAQQDTAAKPGDALASRAVPGKQFGEDLIELVKQLVCGPCLPTLSSAHVCSCMEFAALTCKSKSCGTAIPSNTTHHHHQLFSK